MHLLICKETHESLSVGDASCVFLSRSHLPASMSGKFDADVSTSQQPQIRRRIRMRLSAPASLRQKRPGPNGPSATAAEPGQRRARGGACDSVRVADCAAWRFPLFDAVCFEAEECAIVPRRRFTDL